MSRPTLILPRYILPVRPRAQLLENHGVVIRDDQIVALMEAGRARQAYKHAELVELPRHVLLPGLINAHTHSPMTLLRGYADDVSLQQWLNRHIWPAEKSFVDRDFVRDGTRLAIAEMIRGGTTCFNEQYFYPDEIAKVVEEAGARAVVGLPLLDQETCWARNFDEYMEKGLAVMQSFDDSERVSFCLAPHAPYSVSDDGLAQISRVSADLDIKVTLHCLETAYDVEHSVEVYGVDPLQRLARLGLMNDALIAVHMTRLSAEDCRQVAASGVHVAHCPQSNFKLASGICPLAELVNAGANVCIGTDGAASNNNLDLLEEARFASLVAKGVSGDATAIDAVQTLDMMTINGATALGMEDAIGTIESGKQADVIALDLAAVQSVPLHNVFSQVAYAAATSQFTDVWIAGERVLKNGGLRTIDEDELFDMAGSWQVRMQDERRSRKAY